MWRQLWRPTSPEALIWKNWNLASLKNITGNRQISNISPIEWKMDFWELILRRRDRRFYVFVVFFFAIFQIRFYWRTNFDRTPANVPIIWRLFYSMSDGNVRMKSYKL
jgi:hypothetical protein